jgi:pyrroloquinoline quinone biosynthesis protein B
VLGHAQDGGLPQTGCYSNRCNRARSESVYVSSLALVVPEARAFYLVDATPDLTRQMDLIDEPGFRERASARHPFDGIFLTHAHMGHYLGLALLGREGLAIRPTACYCSPAMERMLRENAPWSLLVDEGRLFFPRAPMETWHSVDGHFDMRMFAVPHRPEFSDTVGYVFRGPNRSVLFIPDIDSWERWERPIEEVVSEVDVALLDGSFYSASEVPGRRVEDIPHPLIPHTMDRLQETLGSEHEVLFIHLNNSNPALDAGGPQEAEILKRGFGLARQGLRIDL